MNLQITSVDKKVIKDLLNSSDGIIIYALFEKYKFSPAQVSKFTRKFLEHGAILIKNDKLFLTEYGRKWIIAHRKEIFLQERKNTWEKIPEEWKITVEEK
ncbi:MAG: hypothetical protein KA146_12705 [Leptospiraceae bacterium]|nr:hypothetical protein [Leptospiraceae bacterium]